MNDVFKVILTVLITSVLSAVPTIQVLSVKIDNVKQTVSEVKKDMKMFDRRTRELEKHQAVLLERNR